MTLQPMGSRVLIKRDETETKVGSIIIHSAIQEKSLTGTVVAVGPGITTEAGVHLPMTLEVGDKVLYTKGTGVEVKVQDEELLVCKEEDLVGVFR
jgi:chaperonin GroES